MMFDLGYDWRGDGFSKIRNSFDDVLVCSFDSAGHGKSEVPSIEMRLDLINQEIYDVIIYLAKKYTNIPIIIYALSYGGYRTVTTIANFDLPNIKHIIFVNPAFKMLEILQKLKDFDYKNLKKKSTVPVKAKLNKYLSKEFIDDLYFNNIYSMQFKSVPSTIFIGENDTLIPRQDTLDFAKEHNCKIIYLDDEHCIGKQESWEKIVEFIKKV